MIRELQSKNHVIVLMIDANQSHSECFSSKGLKPFSIEWLSLQQGMDDPFVQLTGHHPNSTTQTPNHDIDFILTYGVNVINISTMSPNYPSHSDHLGLVLDLDLHSFFSSMYLDICSTTPRALTSGNKSSVDSYIKYVSEQLSAHKIPD
jgi:endonuclease/exonuclease/phosphatase family metal-dependent hydrolase